MEPTRTIGVQTGTRDNAHFIPHPHGHYVRNVGIFQYSQDEGTQTHRRLGPLLRIHLTWT